MGIEDIIRNRRSVRKYLSMPVDNEIIIQLLNTAIWSPSACNRQEYYFIIADDKKLISRIVDAGGSRILLDSSKVVFILYSSLTYNLEYADHIQSASAIIQNFILLAHERGIVTCWICHLPRKKELRKLLNIPRHIDVVAAISLGYADLTNNKPVERKYEVNDVLGYNTFYAKRKLKINKRIYIKMLLIQFYYLFPRFIKKRINKFLNKHFVKKFEN